MLSAPDKESAAVRTWIKICGCASWNDASTAIEAGADAIGMIFAPSPRRISWDAAREIARKLPGDVEPVAVFVDPSDDEINAVRMLFPSMSVQLAGNETAEFVHRYGDRAIKVIHVRAGQDPSDIADAVRLHWQALILFDAYEPGTAGGTGKTFPWEIVTEIGKQRHVVVAGGLTPENVGECIRTVRPFGVDVRSGVETDGHKDAEKIAAFMRAVREADER